MKTLTIRGLSEQLYEELKKKSKKSDKSMNKYLLSIIEKFVGNKPSNEKYDDLDQLFGKWSKDESQLIKKEIKKQKVIDKEIWK